MPSQTPAVPLYLTKAERKKLRTKNRVERQRDLQEQVKPYQFGRADDLRIVREWLAITCCAGSVDVLRVFRYIARERV